MTVLGWLAAWILLSPVVALLVTRPLREVHIVSDAATVYEFVHGPRDGELADEPSVLDLAPGPAGEYAEHGTVLDNQGRGRRALRWTPRPGGHRNPPRCKEACCAGCPAAGLAGA